jgi:LysR family hydrogen peroxide-inducible transcriptional activator
VIYTIGPYLLPHLIPRVHAAAPSMPLLIQENYTARLAESLKRGDLDVIVVALPFEEPGIVTQAVYDEPFRVLLPAGHGWESEERIPASRLAEAPLLLLGAGNCFRDQVLEACPLCRPGEGLQRTLEGSSSRPSATWSPPAPASPCCPAPPPTRCPAAIRCSPCAPSPRRNPSAASPWPGASYPRSGAIDVIRAAILDSPLQGVKPVGRGSPAGGLISTRRRRKTHRPCLIMRRRCLNLRRRRLIIRQPR